MLCVPQPSVLGFMFKEMLNIKVGCHMRDHAIIVNTKFKDKQRNKNLIQDVVCKLFCSTISGAPKLAYAVVISLLCIIGVDCSSPAGANDSSPPMSVKGPVSVLHECESCQRRCSCLEVDNCRELIVAAVLWSEWRCEVDVEAVLRV